MSNYSLTIQFATIDELLNFTNAYDKISIKSEIKTIKSNDKRGSKTSELHKRAKHYEQIHPSIPYRKCLIFVANNPDSNETKEEYLSDTEK